MSAATPTTPRRGPGAVLLAPVLVVVRRLRLPARLLLLTAVLLVPVLLLGRSYLALSAPDIAETTAEREGLAVLRPAVAGLAELAGGRPLDLSPLRAAVAAHPELGVEEEMAAVDATASGATTPAGVVGTAGALVDLVEAVSRASNVTLDPDLDSSSLADATFAELPDLLLEATQARVPTEATTVDERVAEQALLGGTLRTQARHIRDDLEVALADTDRPALAREVQGLTAAAAAADALSASIVRDLENREAADVTTVASAATAAAEPTIDAFDALLSGRVDELTAAQREDLVATLAALVVALWLVAGMVVLTRRDAGRTVQAVQALAEGDLRAKDLPDGRDEFGDVGRSLDAATTRLRTMITTISDDAVTLAAASEEVSVASASIASAAQHTSARAQLASGAAQEVFSHIDSLSAASTEFGASIGEISHSASEAARVAVKATDLARLTTTTVEQLGRSSAEITDVIGLIRAVAEQTNVLALNATIEAARAGEAGRGFAVVAGEVKDLAQKTAAATADITDRVHQIQTDGAAAATAIGQIATVVEEITEHQTAIAGAVEQQSVTATEISQRAVAAATRSGDITDSVGIVADTAQVTSGSAADSQSASLELARMSTQLQTLVAQFQH
ncbi:methyl-accepting chemotaxis protein [Phycicoccus sp. MAQZ13P-2]|uniref:methyl-accepting chemotaxis protein n=1 Tax=Phycicoccus mangrovi TaxID=2840470 RepID=UPI001C001CE2|nr:methyl-accepting chemotaxis protein [Phycicoccus mangrovi]MBT9255973.1 methyl-accepting chemotaxis protein [Phycicoccus mangrovi]MBT9274567.1 methyl-accepting chemotaxis protein [Phycicoccus mangrovi]